MYCSKNELQRHLSLPIAAAADRSERGEIRIADVRAQVMLSLHADFENYTTFKPHEHHDKTVHAVADEVIAWSGALKGLREPGRD